MENEGKPDTEFKWCSIGVRLCFELENFILGILNAKEIDEKTFWIY